MVELVETTEALFILLIVELVETMLYFRKTNETAFPDFSCVFMSFCFCRK